MNNKSEVLLAEANLNSIPKKEHENLNKSSHSTFIKGGRKEKKEKHFNPNFGKIGTEKFSNETKEKLVTKKIIYKWLGCVIVLTAMGFVSIFVLRVYKAEIYFERGRRISEYERQNKTTVPENGLLFVKHAILLNPYETFYRDELCRTYIEKALKTNDEALLQKAYVEVNNSLKLIPQHYLSFFHLGMIHQMLSENFSYNTANEATTYYKKAIESDPFQYIFHSNLASMHIKSGNLDQSIEELCQSYLIQPSELRDIGRLSTVYLQKGDLENGLVFTKKAIELNPNESGYYNNLGAIFYKKGMNEEAIDAFKKAIEKNPKDATCLNNLARIYLSLGKYDELIPFCKKLIELNPSVPDYYNNLGVVYKNQKQVEDAVQLFKKALELAPDSPVYTHNLASTYFDQEKHTESKDILQTFNKTYPNHNYIDIHLLLANLYSKNTDWERVISECEQAIKIDTKSITAYKMLGITYYNMRQYELAEKMLNQTLALTPDDQEAKDLLAKIPNKVKKDSSKLLIEQ